MLNAVLFCAIMVVALGSSSHKDILAAAKKTTLDQINAIRTEWEIDKYPLFLRSAQMHKSSWEMMKHRFMAAIVSGMEKKSEFHISFMGSSVAAGHDSLFKFSYPMVVGDLMAPSFAAVGINLTTSNNAIANNPCMPYDACVETFAGEKADMVHWEQSFNCFDAPPCEQFARQASFLPKKPIVVYSGSGTANWDPKECDSVKPKNGLTTLEAKLLKHLDEALKETEVVSSAIELIVSELNHDEFKQQWDGSLKDIVNDYARMGVQGFTHLSHGVYKCQGPYIRTWTEGAAPWHPSVISHRLRASHHAFFWLLAFREALMVVEGLLVGKGQSFATIATEVHDREAGYDKKHVIPETSKTKINGVDIPDRVQCFTTLDPPMNTKNYLWDIIVGGKHDITKFPDTQAKQNLFSDKWGVVMYDALITPEWTKVGRDKGYADHKYVLYGGIDAGPLSFKMDVMEDKKEAGAVLICEVAGEFGATPAGFGNYHMSGDPKAPPLLTPEIYYTLDVPTRDFVDKPFEFDVSKAMKVTYSVKREDFCMQLATKVGPGHHVLTVVPTDKRFIHIGYILLP